MLGGQYSNYIGDSKINRTPYTKTQDHPNPIALIKKMQTKYIIKIIKGYKGRQRLTKEIPVKYIAPLLSVYIY